MQMQGKWKVCHFMIGIATRDIREEENNIAILNSSVQVVAKYVTRNIVV